MCKERQGPSCSQTSGLFGFFAHPLSSGGGGGEREREEERRVSECGDSDVAFVGGMIYVDYYCMLLP